MKTLFDAASIEVIRGRMQHLRSDAPALWGKMPAPQIDVLQVLPSGKDVTEVCKIVSISVGLRAALQAYSNEATPATCGAAIDVPLILS